MPEKRIGLQIEGPSGESFELKCRLGNGAFGEVYKATGIESNIDVAVKMVPASRFKDPQALAVRTVLNESLDRHRPICGSPKRDAGEMRRALVKSKPFLVKKRFTVSAMLFADEI